MLIADEVGLGKTIVAKGIIAKAFKHYLEQYENVKKQNPTFNVVYICSNLALANQNIRKLNFTGKDECVEDTINRLNYLAIDNKEKQQLFKINSLTPGTSFDQRSSTGEARERLILYKLLTAYDVFEKRSNGLIWILKGASHIDSMKAMVTYDPIVLRSDLYKRFRDELSRIAITKERLPKINAALNSSVETTLWKGLQRLAESIDGRNHHTFSFQNEIIKELRRILAYLCLDYLGADIFILDEFQRYANLIKTDVTDDPAVELARRVFQVENAKVLMLSATPFKPYTNDFDEASGEVHYKEFKSVLQFLMERESESFWKEFEEDRKSLYQIIRHSEKLGDVFEKGIAKKEK
ncbi:MAG: helicase, partial [Sphingobacteriales bacterium]